MKRILCIILICLVTLCGCGGEEKQFESLKDYIDEYSFSKLRDEEHPETVLLELAKLLPLSQNDRAELELLEKTNYDYEYKTFLFDGSAEFSISKPALSEDENKIEYMRLSIDMSGSEYAEAYYVCEKILDNLTGSNDVDHLTVQIDDVEAHRKALERLFEDFDRTKSFRVYWMQSDKKADYYISIGYSTYSVVEQHSYLKIFVSRSCDHSK